MLLYFPYYHITYSDTHLHSTSSQIYQHPNSWDYKIFCLAMLQKIEGWTYSVQNINCKGELCFIITNKNFLEKRDNETIVRSMQMICTVSQKLALIYIIGVLSSHQFSIKHNKIHIGVSKFQSNSSDEQHKEIKCKVFKT